MKPMTLPSQQRGVITIFISVVMLILITVMVTTAFSMSTMNLRAIGNVQSRDEAVAAASSIIELTVGSDFYSSPTAVPGNLVDIDNNGSDDYVVDLALPVCVRASIAKGNSTSSVTLPGMSFISAWNTIWELDATATDAATGAVVRVRHGVRVLMTEIQKNTWC